MSTDVIPFIQWGSFHSKDIENPDVLEIEVVTLEQWDSEFSTNVQVKYHIHGSWEDRILPLRSLESNNPMLLNLWNKAVSEKRIKVGTRLSIKTHMGKSRNHNDMRKYQLGF